MSKKLLTNLYKRKIFKTNIFHDDNNDGYEWDDYDTTHYYEEDNNLNYIIVNVTKDNYKKIRIFRDDTTKFHQVDTIPKNIFIVNYVKNNYKKIRIFKDDKNVYFYCI